ncbi:MAG: pitrilysin family protein [bacterium]|nr:pitrilysin family protein [bacterium]
MHKKIILKNGLRLIIVPQKSTQAATVLVLVGTGSKYETKEISGISHFLEHMFFKGTSKRPDKVEIAETLDRVGGMYNAFTGEDYTGYFAKVAAPYFNLALDWVADIFLNSLLPEKEMEKEKGVIIEEINMIYDNPMAHVSVLWSELLYGDQPAGWDIAGTKETVSKMNRQKLADYFKNHYVASDTIVCLSGNFKEKLAIEKAKKYFSAMLEGSPVIKQKVVEIQEKPKALIHYKETDQTHLRLGVRGFNIFHPKRYVQDVLGDLLGGMMSSRLFIEVREKLGLAYYVRTEVDSNPDTGYLVTAAGVDSQRIEKVISVILREYRKIAEQKVGSLELKKTKNNIKGKLALVLEASDAQASFYGSQELLEGKILTPEEIFKRIDQVTANDMQKLAKIIFQPKNLNLALVGPFKDTAYFERLLAKSL